MVIEDERWIEAGLTAVATRAADATFGHLGLDGLDCACLGTNDVRIAELNAEFRGKSGPTNVLSWPSETLAPASPGAVPPPPNDPETGDIALAFETCLTEAREAGIAIGDHVSHLVIHGILHLLGYDHGTDADADLMETTEIAILASLRVANPYL